MTSIPLWVPLAVAGVGVLGTLSAAIFTQIWSSKLEGRRWNRERLAEERRWQHEKEERAEQWRREDQARWLAERRATYVTYIMSLDLWHEALLEAHGQVVSTGSHDEELGIVTAKLQREHIRAWEGLRIIAPDDIADKAWQVTFLYQVWQISLTGSIECPSVKDLSAAEKGLRAAIRRDLGINQEQPGDGRIVPTG